MEWWDKPFEDTQLSGLIAWEFSDGGSSEKICTVFHTGNSKIFKTKEERDQFLKKNGYDKDKKLKELKENKGLKMWD